MKDERAPFASIAAVCGVVLFMSLAMALAAATRSKVAVLVLLAVSAVAGIGVFGLALFGKRGIVRAVPPSLRGLHPDQRRIVVATANNGARVGDPSLAPAVVSYARDRMRRPVGFLFIGALTVSHGASDLLSAPDGGRRLLDILVIAAWLLAAGLIGRHLLRYHRAIEANRGITGSAGVR